MNTPPTDKLAEAEKLIEDWPNEVARRMHNLSQRGYAKALYAADIAEIVTIVLAAQDLISYEKGREDLKDEQRADMSWTNWEEGFAETWMDINPNHGQANAKCYIKKLVDKYVEKGREEQRKKDIEDCDEAYDFGYKKGQEVERERCVQIMFRYTGDFETIIRQTLNHPSPDAK